jgi:hypothetical protein
MRKAKTGLIVALLLVSALPFVQKAEATLGEANVYIICLNNVPTNDSWVDDFQSVKDGAIDACMLQGTHIQFSVPRAHPKRSVDYPPYYEATPYVVTSWSQYASIITSYSEVIVVNTHGQYLPVPSSYNKGQWVDKIADAMLNRRLTWVHVGGYTFFRVWYQQTGTGEEWGEQGFKQLMNHINKGDVDLSPYPYSEDERASTLLGDQQIGLNWYDRDGRPITGYAEATLGKPLKIGDFKEYLILPIFDYGDFWTGAAIAFVKAGARYTDGHGCGAYVHIGARYLYLSNGSALDADYGRGFIGTAAALWAESMGFDAKMDAKQWGSGGPWSENASLVVQPSISGVRETGTDLIVTMEFAVYGATQSHQDDVFYFKDALFFIDEVSGSEWSDVTMRVDLGFSREGYGDGLVLSGLYDEGQAPYGLATSSIMWILGAPTLLAAHPLAAPILWGIGGVKLLGSWIEQSSTENYSGVGDFASHIDFRYLPAQNYTVSDGKAYREFMTLTTVELLIPTSGKSGWLILPLEYNISALPNWYGLEPGWLDVNDTLELAIWLGAGEGCQDDAGSTRDATNSNPVSVTFPGSYHGYLGGGDNDDWYTFTMESGKSITVQMTPPPFVDFDLELYSPNNTLKDESHQGAGTTDTIQYTTDCGGTWKLRIYKVQGSGVYSLDLNFIIKSLYISASSGGTTDPDPGTHTYSYGSSVNVTATAYSGYQFVWWWLDGGLKYGNQITVTMDSDHTLYAYFTESGGGGGEPCPTLYAWNGNDYVDYGVIDIHNPSGEDVIREVFIAKQDLAVEDRKVKLRLQEGWEGLNFSESVIDQVKLYAINEDGKLKLCRLTSATHSRLGDVHEYLASSDDVKAQIFLLETMDLTFKVQEDSQGFVFVIEGCNIIKY